MRYNALKNQTEKLPQLFVKNLSQKPIHFTAKNTRDCIHTGVMAGAFFEIEQMIEAYKTQYQDLKIVLTGGDMDYLAGNLKTPILARSNFLLEGLLHILRYNE